MDMEKLSELEDKILAAEDGKFVRIVKNIYVGFAQMWGKSASEYKLSARISVPWKGIVNRKTLLLMAGEDYKDFILRAIEWRNNKEIEVGKPRSEDDFRVGYHRYSNPTSIPEITFKTYYYRKPCSYFEVECAGEGGKTIKSRFSIDDLGRIKAFELAKEFYEKNHRDFMGTSTVARKLASFGIRIGTRAGDF